MKFTIKRQVEIDVAYVELILPVKCDYEDIPADFPLRKGDTWHAIVGMDSGIIENWPSNENEQRKLEMKVTDAGVYVLLDANRNEIARRDDYVPNVVPGSYGDYVELTINPGGKIANWNPSNGIADFFPK